MSGEQSGPVDEKDSITQAERKNVRLWAIALIVIFATATVLTSWSVYTNKIAAIKRHDNRMNPEVGEGGKNPPATTPPAGANPVSGGI